MRSFLNRKRLSYFILQDIPDLFSNLKYSNKQLYIRRWYIIYMCKISVQNDIIKDILKKNNDVHWISDGTIVWYKCNRQPAQMVEYCYNKYECWSGASVSDMHACRSKFNRHYCQLGATVKGMANGRMQLLQTRLMVWCKCNIHGCW